MMAFILATDFDFIAYMSKMAFSLETFFTPVAFLEYDTIYIEVGKDGIRESDLHFMRYS